jgi:hypothetical protein
LLFIGTAQHRGRYYDLTSRASKCQGDRGLTLAFLFLPGKHLYKIPKNISEYISEIKAYEESVNRETEKIINTQGYKALSDADKAFVVT